MLKNLTILTETFTQYINQSHKNIIIYSIIKSAMHSHVLDSSEYPDLEVMKQRKYFNYYVENIISEHKGLSKYIKICKRNSFAYLIDHKTAEQLVSLIKDDLLQNINHVIEMNSGLGLLTQELLKAGVPFIHMFEKDPDFHIYLNNLRKNFPEKLNLKSANLLNISKLMHPQYIRSHKVNTFKLLDDVKKKEWGKESCMQIIGVTNKLRFINHLILSIIFQTCFMMYGRPLFYLGVLPSVWEKFVEPKKMSVDYIMFQTLFNYKVFGSVDRRAFLPWTKYEKKNHKDYFSFYIVKLEPKAEIFKMFGGKENLIYFWHFVRYCLYKSSRRVIPILEQLIPNCGVRLIRKNYTIYTEFNDLTISQVYELFMEFKSWPEFEGSTFKWSATDVQEIYNTYLHLK